MPRRDLAGRWDAVGHGLRGWAIENPHDFTLLYGSPVPDYEAPAERTVEAGTAVLAILVSLLDDARRAGALADPGHLGLHADDVETAVGPLLADADVRRHQTSTRWPWPRDCAPGPCCWVPSRVRSSVSSGRSPTPGRSSPCSWPPGRSTFLNDPVNDPVHDPDQE